MEVPPPREFKFHLCIEITVKEEKLNYVDKKGTQFGMGITR